MCPLVGNNLRLIVVVHWNGPVESTKYVRPIGGKRDSGTATESSGIDDSGTETNDSFRSDSDELETD